MILCIIPARGGSKGIRHKNIVPVCGKPLVAWSVEHALASLYIDEVVVATDCDAIAAVARQYGATIYRRSERSAGDDSPSEVVLREVLHHYPHVELLVFLQATSPLRHPRDIDGCIETLRLRGADSAFTGRVVHGYTWESPPSGALVPMHRSRRRRQDQTSRVWEENGSVYVLKPDVLRQYNSRFGGAVAVHPMHPLDSFQIDDPEDIELMEQLMEVRGVAHARAI